MLLLVEPEILVRPTNDRLWLHGKGSRAAHHVNELPVVRFILVVAQLDHVGLRRGEAGITCRVHLSETSE